MKGIAVLFLAAFIAVAAGKECPAEQSADWSLDKLLVHEDCDKFYKCTFGEPVEQECPAGLLFDAETLECGWPQDVECGNRNRKIVPSASNDPEKQLISALDSKLIKLLKIVVEPEVLICIATDCGDEDDNDGSQEEGDQPGEEESEEESDEEESEEKEDEIEFQENGCPVEMDRHWLLPNKEDCNAFYYCVWGELVPRRCAAETHFNPILQVCDRPEDAGCVVAFNKHLAARAQIRK